MPKEEKLKEVWEQVNHLSPVETRNSALIAKAKEKYGSEGEELAVVFLRAEPKISEEEFWEYIDGLVNMGPILCFPRVEQ